MLAARDRTKLEETAADVRQIVGLEGAGVAVDETVILLHPPLPLAGVSIVVERGRQQNDSLVNG